MRVVLDTNVLISGIFWQGDPYAILELWAKSKIQVIAMPEILQEYFAVLKRLDHQGSITQQWMVFILEHTELVSSNHEIKICRDP